MKISFETLKSELLIIDILINPEKYAVLIDTERIVADAKVTREGVDRYKDKIDAGEDVGTLPVVKHPRIDLYAVFDGHHRYHAQKEKGFKQMKCAPIPDLIGLLFSLESGLLFYVTEKGYIQPSREFTRRVRAPVLGSLDKLKNYLERFLNEPEKLKQKSI